MRWRLIGLFAGDTDACTYFKIQLMEVNISQKYKEIMV